MSTVRPKQKVSKAEKTEEWYNNNAKWIMEQANFNSGDRWEMRMLYEASMGILDKSIYKYVLNPYNSPDENLKNYPAQLRNYDIITPILSLYLGEKADRPFNHQVINTNGSSTNNYKEQLNQAVEANLAQRLVNELNQLGVPTGVPTRNVPPIQDVVEKHKETYDDKKAKYGQDALDYLKYNLNLKDKYQEALYDWLVVAKAYTYKDIFKNDVTHEVVPPLEMWHGTTKTGFVEDADWALRRSRFNMSNVIDRFHEVLSDKKVNGEASEIDALEEFFNQGGTVASTTFVQTPNLDKVQSSSNQSPFVNSGGLMDVFHCVWKSFKKVGILKYQDELGLEQEMEVDESYVLDTTKGDISIEWDWQSEINETYVIGDYQAGKAFFKYQRPVIAQRNELSNTSLSKLPYNGRTGYSERNRLSSIVKQILPYQALYNIYHYRGELTLARNKDKIMLMPKGLLPAGWSEDKFLYFAEATGIAFFDETKPNAAAVLNAIRGIDMGLGNYVTQMRELLAGIKAEAWDAVGMNRQRYGDVKASDGKGNNDQAVIRSSVISREMFRRFERLEDSDMQGLLDYSKLAWVDGKKGMYINSEGKKAFLEIDPENHLHSDYGIFSVDSAEEDAKLRMAKDYAFGWAQKGTSPASTVLEVLDSNNMSKLKDFIRKAEQVERDYQASITQNEQAHQQAIEDKQTARDDARNQTSIEVAKINAGAATYGHDVKANTEQQKLNAQSNGESDTSNIDSAYNDYLLAVQEKDIAKQEQGLKELGEVAKRRLKEVDQALKKQKMDNDFKIAKQNKNRYDK